MASELAAIRKIDFKQYQKKVRAIWDICNSVFEFVIVFFIFQFLTNNPLRYKEESLFALGSIILSIFFCLDIPHYVLLNVILFIGLQLICFTDVEIRHRLFASISSVFLTISLEMMLLSLLPETLLHTYLGDSIVVFLLVAVLGCLYFINHKNPVLQELQATTYRFRYVISIVLIFWTIIGQRYQSQLSSLWKFLPGLITLGMFILLFGAIYFYLRFQRSIEHQKIISYEAHLSGLNSYMEAIRKENHDYKHQIRYLYERIATASDLPDLRKTLIPYIDSLNASTAVPDAILSVDNTMIKAVLYGGYLRCQEEGISFSFDSTDLLPAFPIEDYLLVQILENLLSNAIEHNMSIPEEKKRFVHMRLFADHTDNLIAIENAAGDMDIPLQDIFRSGFSTKDHSHQGLGLTNTQEILSEHHIAFYGKKNSEKSSVTFTLLYKIS